MARATRVGGINPSALPKWTPVDVEWEDAAHEGDPFNSDKLIEQWKPVIRHTLGHFFGDDGERMFVALSRDSKMLGDTEEIDCQAGDVLPHGMIRKVTVLQPKSTRKRR